MNIRIINISEVSKNSWYVDKIGQVFNVVSSSIFSSFYVVNTVDLFEEGKRPHWHSPVLKIDAEIVESGNSE